MAEKRKVGRPYLYKPEYCQMLLEHMKKGYSFEVFAADIGVCADTLYQWVKDEPDFSEAFKRGKVLAHKYWQTIGIGQATGKLKGNSGTWIFWMKNRFGWREDSHTENTDDDLEFVE